MGSFASVAGTVTGNSADNTAENRVVPTRTILRMLGACSAHVRLWVSDGFMRLFSIGQAAIAGHRDADFPMTL